MGGTITVSRAAGWEPVDGPKLRLHRAKKLRRRTLKHAAPRRLKAGPSVAQEPAPQGPANVSPSTSAALSYVFVAVTLACTFLV